MPVFETRHHAVREPKLAHRGVHMEKPVKRDSGPALLSPIAIINHQTRKGTNL